MFSSEWRGTQGRRFGFIRLRRLNGMREGALRYADDSANLVRRAVGENVIAVYHTPFVTPWRGAEMMILVVIDFIAAIPVFVFDWSTFLPFLVLDVCVV